jgi:RNA-directed DNA polymerase
LWKSDDCIVPLKPDLQSGRSKPGNAGAGKAVRPSRGTDETSPALCGMDKMFARLDRIFKLTRGNL